MDAMIRHRKALPGMTQRMWTAMVLRIGAARRAGAIAAAVSAMFAQGALAAPTHPLDPLDAGELLTIRDVLTKSGRFSPDTNFTWIQLAEPPKQSVEEFSPGQDFPRHAEVDAVDYAAAKTYNVIVDLKKREIASLTDLGASQPGLTERDDAIAREVVDADPQIKQALIKRGVDIPRLVSEAANVHYMSVGIDRGRDRETGRLARVMFTSGNKSEGNTAPYLDGIMAIVDLYQRRVVHFRDVAGVPSVRIPHDPFDPKARPSRARIKPLVARQPGGRNFTVDGQVVAWRNWRLRLGFNLREGLVLYQVGYQHESRLRPILYRASISEVLTAYADPNEFWSWMQILDGASFGLGYLSTGVRPGRQVPANAVTLNPLLPAPSLPQFSERLNDRIYLYERDAGNLIYYEQDGRSIHARASELVIGSMVSLGNYVYAFNWVLRPDGSFAFEAELSGTVVAKFVRATGCETCAAIAQGVGPDGGSRSYESSGSDEYGGMVHPGAVGVSHQHWFNLRLDFDLDGKANAVMENNVRRAHQDDTAGSPPNAAPFRVRHTVFGKAVDAKRHMSHETSRTWTVFNPSVAKSTRSRAGYTVMAMGNASGFLPRAREGEVTGFTSHQFWVTPYRHGQHYATGSYPNQSKADYADSLHHYADNSSIYDRDIVVWYSLGDTHVPRPEDFPVMSSKRISVSFHPDGFFERNPALGAADVEDAASRR
jgi:primary-amine oxidase